MRGLDVQKGDPAKRNDLLRDSAPCDGGLLKPGLYSLLLHVVLVAFIILSLKPGGTRAGSPVYRVTLQPFSPAEKRNQKPLLVPRFHDRLSVPLPLLRKTQIGNKEIKPLEEIKQRDPVFDMKSLDQVIPPPIQPVVTRISLDEEKQLAQRQEEERVKEPIPFPIATASRMGIDLNVKEENSLPIPLSPSQVEEEHNNANVNTASAEGHGTGVGGSGSGASRDGPGIGQGGSGWGGSGKGPGIGQGDFRWAGSGKGTVAVQGGSGGGGSGDELGPWRGGSGGGGSSNGGTLGPYPRYAENPKPVYPQEAKKKGYEGEVLLRVEVLSNGRVGQVEVTKSSGYDTLDRSALATVKQWKFIPARKGEAAIPYWVNIPIRFRLL